MFERNHYFPKYNLKYWKEIGSKLYDKKIKEDREFNPANNFYLYKFYYFNGTAEIEQRLGKIESYMSQILRKISDSISTTSIELSEYEISFIQLFLFLQASRQLNTTEVIKIDESGMYKNNNYLFGIHNLKSNEQMEGNMYSLISALESFIKEETSEDLNFWLHIQAHSMHLIIAKNNDSHICQSDVCCIIENDMDSNHMYTYFPQTPNIAFFLVKTKYFYREWHRIKYLNRNNDQVISAILGDLEIGLFCQYKKEGFSEQSASYFFPSEPINFSKLRKKQIKLNFFELSNNIVDQYNKILFDDGQIFVHSQKVEYVSHLESMTDPCRKITLSW